MHLFPGLFLGEGVRKEEETRQNKLYVGENMSAQHTSFLKSSFFPSIAALTSPVTRATRQLKWFTTTPVSVKIHERVFVLFVCLLKAYSLANRTGFVCLFHCLMSS